jgi:ZIP family zinc transporter
LIDYWQLLLLGSIAGFTIFLGLPLASLQNLNVKKKGFLNAFAIGILVFLIIDVFSHAWESTQVAASSALAGKQQSQIAVFSLLAMFGGLAIGLIGLVLYESIYMKKPVQQQEQTGRSFVAARADRQQLLQEVRAYKLAMMIAVGIGAHNFSEGLAIGQSYVSGTIGLALILIIGFGAHNATEGFGITGPLIGLLRKPKIRFLILAGFVGGGPTFIGTLVGSLWLSPIAYVLFLSTAGGALVYVSMLMYNSGRKQTTNAILMMGIFVGLCTGFITDLIVSIGGG